MTTDKRSGLDKLFDAADSIMGSVESALDGVPEPEPECDCHADDDDHDPDCAIVVWKREQRKARNMQSSLDAGAQAKDMTRVRVHPDNMKHYSQLDEGLGKVINAESSEVPAQPAESKSATPRNAPREMSFRVRQVSKGTGGGVLIMGEGGASNERVVLRLDAESWKQLYDAADWLRAVRD